MDHSLPHLVLHVVHILTLAQGIVILVMVTLVMPALKKMVRIKFNFNKSIIFGLTPQYTDQILTKIEKAISKTLKRKKRMLHGF